MLKQFKNGWVNRRRLALVSIVIAAVPGCTPEPESVKPPRIVKAMQVVEASTISSRSFPGRASRPAVFDSGFFRLPFGYGFLLASFDPRSTPSG